MSKSIFINDLLEWQFGEDKVIERVLWIDEGYIIAFTFDIFVDKGFPTLRNVSEIEEAIEAGVASKLTSDPWMRIVREEDFSDKEREIRDKAWEIVSDLVDSEPSIYDRNSRGSLVRKVVEEYNVGRTEGKLVEKTVYRYLRRFWQRGKIRNALLPDYVNSGGKGKTKSASQKKRGRPRKYAHDPEIGRGINITEADKKIFRVAISRYYNNPKQNSLKTAYELTIKEYYTEEITFDDSGNKRSVLVPLHLRPTFTQFQYWYKTEQRDIKKSISSRRGAKRFALEHRAITGSSKMETEGPGSRFQIDATIADVYLVSKYNPSWIIGRPVVYLTMDVFSRMIVGLYVGLEGPSWIGAMMALLNTASDKVSFCQEYDVAINEEEWPCHHVPDAILGDGGELKGMSVEKLIPNLNIRIENAAPYRADLKGLVERHFRILHEQVKPFIPGFVDTDFRQRGGRDYRLDSKLDIDQFTRILIHIVSYHNHHYLEKYERDADMIADDVKPIPIELWKWGIANRSGRLRNFGEEIVKLNLMPTERATITPMGIKLRGKEMYYTCETAEREQWFERARSNMLSKEEKILTISYDPRKLNCIYIPSSDGRKFEVCPLLDPENRYSDKGFYDIEYMLAYEDWQRQRNQGRQLQNKISLMEDIEKIVSAAEEMTEAASDHTMSKARKVSGIRENRLSEKSERREHEGFELGDAHSAETHDREESKVESPSQTKASSRPDRLDLLRRKQQERRHDEN